MVLIETWKTNEKNKIIDTDSDFIEYNVCRPVLKTAKRGSGGITVLVKKQLASCISYIESHKVGIIWFKIIREQSHAYCDIYLCCLYIPPKDSSRHVLNDEDLFDVLYTDILKYNVIGKVIVCGDMNARCGNLLDYTEYDFNDIGIVEDVCIPVEHNVKQRISEDTKINHYGRRFIDLCIANDLLIVNGRSVSDPAGSCTCYTYNGSSVVDYVLCSKELIDCIDLKVDDINSLSDHCIIRTFLSVATPIHSEGDTKEHTPCNTFTNSHTLPLYKWKEQYKDDYVDNINSSHMLAQLEHLYDKLGTNVLTSQLANTYTNELTEIFTENSRKCIKQPIHKHLHTAQNNAPWHDRECKTLRNTFIKERNNLKRHKHPQTLQATQTARVTYNKCCRTKKAIYDKNITESYVKLKHENPRLFWKTIKPHDKYECSVTLDSFYCYFSELCSQSTTLQNPTHTYAFSQHYSCTVDELDKEISITEVEHAIKLLKCDKSPGQDNVLNECIKYGGVWITHIIARLFNHLYNLGEFPDQWSKGLIVPIYKKGDKQQPANYRPITLLSSLCKLYTSILCRRITEWATENYVFSEAQFGYRPTYSTVDACFTLNLLVNRNVSNNRKLCCAFIDFSTAFDSVCRNILYEKLKEYGMSTKMLRMIMAIYKNVTSSVKINNMHTDSFTCSDGLRQGDSLSPVLFAMSINDLSQRLSEVDKDKNMDILLYADDLAILADSREMLQKKLDILHTYCRENNLTVNISKSKVIIFNSRKHTTPFIYNDCILQEVDSFKYLGMAFNRQGNLKYSQTMLVQQAIRARAILETYLRKHKHMPVNIVFELFDTLIKPILLYACEIWGSKMGKEIEIMHISFIKSVLGVKPSTNTCLLYAETGRFPLYVTIYRQIVKYWLKLTCTSDHRYIAIAFRESPSEWSLFVKKLLYENGFGNVWETNAAHISHPMFIRQFEQRLKDTFMQSCFSDMESSNKCFLYRSLCREFSMASYLYKIHIPANRKAMTRLRLSSHKLMIERGRWLNILPKDRLCTLCNKLEDEFHVICECPRYDTCRKLYIKPYYVRKPSMDKLIQLLNTDNTIEMQKLAIFIKRVFIIYKEVIFD